MFASVPCKETTMSLLSQVRGAFSRNTVAVPSSSSSEATPPPAATSPAPSARHNEPPLPPATTPTSPAVLDNLADRASDGTRSAGANSLFRHRIGGSPSATDSQPSSQWSSWHWRRDAQRGHSYESKLTPENYPPLERNPDGSAPEVNFRELRQLDLALNRAQDPHYSTPPEKVYDYASLIRVQRELRQLDLTLNLEKNPNYTIPAYKEYDYASLIRIQQKRATSTG